MTHGLKIRCTSKLHNASSYANIIQVPGSWLFHPLVIVRSCLSTGTVESDRNKTE